MVHSISRSLPTPAARPPPRHYQTLLTPVLHRRFANACLVSLAVSYVQAVLISDKSNLFWLIFPLSWTGLKCFLLFFLSAMPILILRIAQLHVVKRAYPSPFRTFQRSIGSFSTYSAILVYVLTSVVFTTLYLLSTDKGDQLGIVIEGRSYERPRLNERFLYLIFFSVYAGFLQGIYHVAKDRARLEFPEEPYSSLKEAGKAQAPAITWNVGALVLVTAASGPIGYLPFRRIIWTCMLGAVRHFYWLNRSAALPTFPVGPGLFIRSSVIAFMTVMGSEISHAAFTTFFIEDLFKSGQTVTDKSNDPNGTLITGLRSATAPLTQPMAFRELDHLATNRADRRRAIFSDVDRKPLTWEQIVTECLRAVNDVEIRLTELLTPTTSARAPTTPQTPTATTSPTSPPAIPISQNNILVKTTSRSPGRGFVDMVQSADGASPSAALRKRLPIPESFNTAHSQASVVQSMKDQITPMLASACGKPFRQSVQLVTTGAIPNVRIPLNAISALGKLVIASLDEDDFGVVQGHVGKILQSFCATLETIEKYVANPPLHWTDTEARKAGGHVRLEEPELLMQQLQTTIADITRAFAPFLDDMHLPSDIRKKLPVVEVMQEV